MTKEDTFTAAQKRAFNRAVQDNMAGAMREEARRLAHRVVKRYFKDNKAELDAQIKVLVKAALEKKLPDLAKKYVEDSYIGNTSW